MFKYLFRVFAKANVLSLDIVLGAFLSSVFANYFFGYKARWWYYLVLAFAVWIVYTLDHLVDAFKNKSKTTSPRHLFYYRYARWIFIFVGFSVFLLALLLLFFANLTLIYFGLFVGSIAVLYLVFVFVSRKPSLRLPKELFVAIIYTLGIWGFPMLVSEDFDFVFLGFPFLFFGIVFFVLLLYSRIDLDTDLENKYYGLFAVISENIQELVLRGILIFEICIFFLLVFIFPLRSFLLVFITFFVMILMSLGLYYYRNDLKENYLYRIVGESIFYIPGIMIGIIEFVTFVENLF